MITHVEDSQILIMRWLGDEGKLSEIQWPHGGHKANAKSISDVTNVLAELMQMITGKHFIMNRHNGTTMNWVREDVFGTWYKPDQR
jgi:hypothetical protein